MPLACCDWRPANRGEMTGHKVKCSPLHADRATRRARSARPTSAFRRAAGSDLAMDKCGRRGRMRVPHPVKTEGLASLVADDVSNLFRDRCLPIRRSSCSASRFDLGYVFHCYERGHDERDVQLQTITDFIACTIRRQGNT